MSPPGSHTKAGAHLLAGKLAGGVLLAVSGLFSTLRKARFGGAPIGARAAATTHETPRAPKAFHCPLWPSCGCPGGTTRPECPGLEPRRRGEPT